MGLADAANYFSDSYMSDQPISGGSITVSDAPGPSLTQPSGSWSKGLTDFFKDITDVAAGAVGAYHSTKNMIDPPDPPRQPITPPPPPVWYKPWSYLEGQNITPKDLAFQPNWNLFLAGAALLIVALYLKE